MNVRDVALSLAEALLRSELPPETAENGSPTARRRPVKEKPPFTIAISREVGALGTTTAKEIGKRLGWPVYDQEIINKIAEEMGKPTTHVRGVDERYFNWLEECLGGLVAEYHVSPSAYLKHLIGTVRGLGVKGRCVIVGRGASFILPPETTLRVRLVAELADRIKVIGRLRGVSDREAERWIELTDAARVQFVKRNFGKDPADPLHFDLVLNTSRLTPAECAEAIVRVLHLLEEREPAATEQALPAPALAGTRL
jgi:cytidylate kinase